MYIFEYNREGYLEHYYEKYDNINCQKNFIMCYCFVKDNTVIKIEENGKFKNIIKYKEQIKIRHRFEAGESWINILAKEDKHNEESSAENDININVERRFPDYYSNKSIEKENIICCVPTITSQMVFEDNVLSYLKFKIKNNLTNSWKNLINL